MDERCDSVAGAVLALANGFPGLKEGQRFAFASLDEGEGLALFPIEGEATEEVQRSVTGRIRRVCSWDFQAVCRTGWPDEARRQAVADWLDALGRWMEAQEVPALTEGRRILSLRRAGMPRQAARPADRTETWVMEMTARYEIIDQK